ncbi:hypothetical protein CO540_13420 [Micromonospora sp. WMMA2032]|uniref:hypothetical protein n=1 Tax=Micromonospora sp. WMMA2032 TaxID=2039870 RepID=UPI000C058858|nr:hypothetical protein [Micromonospora sp. WMMA2032]ATO14707.1 hypothetical protein CO540_13420 [Micromonospora sp. WMMA2032]
MDIITYCIEERRIDRSGNTIRTEGRFATRDRDGGLRTFAAMAATCPTRYQPGSGRRLVLVTRGGDR